MFDIEQIVVYGQPRFPNNIDPDLKDLISQLLTKDKTQRLQDPAQMKSHPFFRGFDFKQLEQDALKVQKAEKESGERLPVMHQAPSTPKLNFDSDTYYFDRSFKHKKFECTELDSDFELEINDADSGAKGSHNPRSRANLQNTPKEFYRPQSRVE